MRHNYLFTSESVTEGHPDKIADQISDGILDAIIAQDKTSRVACETILTTGIAFVAGEISTKAYVEIPDIIRDVIKDVGYTDASWGFDANTCSVLTSIHQQSGDIAMGVDSGGAGDQGLVRRVHDLCARRPPSAWSQGLHDARSARAVRHRRHLPG